MGPDRRHLSRALAGFFVCRQGAHIALVGAEAPVGRHMGIVFACLYFALLALSFVPARAGATALAAGFYRSGALVFGGGHVVLPLLRAAVVGPGWISDSAFLAGYGAAQAVPGPLFTFAAYLGAVASVPPGGVAGAALGLVAIFAPGLLLMMAALAFWQNLRAHGNARAAMAGVNAAVVGLLASALYTPYGPARFEGRPTSPSRRRPLSLYVARSSASRGRCDRRRLQSCKVQVRSKLSTELNGVPTY